MTPQIGFLRAHPLSKNLPSSIFLKVRENKKNEINNIALKRVKSN